MKKIFLVLLVSILAMVGYSQSVQPRGSANVTVEDSRFKAKYNLFLPVFNDTTEANLWKGVDSTGGLIFTRDSNAVWVRKFLPKKWVILGNGTGGGGGGGNSWQLGGNALTDAAVEYFGSSNNIDLNFATNGLKRFSLNKGGILPLASTAKAIGIDSLTGYLTYTNGGSATDSANVASFGLLKTTASTVNTWKVDSISIATRLRVQKGIDSLGLVKFNTADTNNIIRWKQSGNDIYNNNTGKVQIVGELFSRPSGSNDRIAIFNSGGAKFLRLDSAGRLVFNSSNASSPAPYIVVSHDGSIPTYGSVTPMVSIVPAASDQSGILIKGNSGQTGNLMSFRNSADDKLLTVDNLGSIAFGSDTADRNSLIDMRSTTKGFLPPRMTSAQRTAISSPATGMVVYQTDGAEGLYQKLASGWSYIGNTVDTTNYMIRLYNGWGINQTGTFPTKTILVDSFNVASRAYAKKVADSMATLKNIYNSDGTQSSTDRVYSLGYTGDYRTLNFGKSDLSEKANIGLQNNSNNKNGYVVIQAYDSTNNTQTITQYFPQAGYKRDLIANISTAKSTDQKAYSDSLTIDFSNFSKLKVKYTADSFVIRNLPRYNLSTDSVMTYNPSTGKVGYKTVTSGGGATPAGNYGNVQLNRFGSLATPASDSLNFSGGLAIKGTLSATALALAAGDKQVRWNSSTGAITYQDTLTDFTISNASHYLPDSLVVPVSTNALKIKNPASGLYTTPATTDSSFKFNLDTSSSGLSGKYLRKTDTTGTYLRLIQGSNVTISGTYPNLTIAASLSGGGGGNVFKDVATQNTFISNIDSAYTTTATAAGTTTLTNASKYTQNFTGVTTQTVVLPDATTLVAGHSYYITNTSTGALTVNKNGGTLISTVAAGQTLSVTVTDISTSAGGWNYEYSGNSLTSSNFIFNETPSGTVNGTNATFTLANTPTAGTVRIYLNGLRQKLTTQYTISGSTITMLNIPGTGDELIVDYLK